MRQPAIRSAASSIWRAIGCIETRVPSRPVETRSTTPHSQIASSSRPVRSASQAARCRRSPFERVLAHDDAEVVLGLGEQAVGVDQLEAVGCFERVPLVDVAVHENGPLVPVRLASPLRTLECVVDRRAAARAVELVPTSR